MHSFCYFQFSYSSQLLKRCEDFVVQFTYNLVKPQETSNLSKLRLFLVVRSLYPQNTLHLCRRTHLVDNIPLAAKNRTAGPVKKPPVTILRQNVTPSPDTWHLNRYLLLFISISYCALRMQSLHMIFKTRFRDLVRQQT